MKKELILSNLRKSLKNDIPIIGVSVGCGLSAKLAVDGGADFILTLSAGKFRNIGNSSISCMLPFSNSNQLVKSFANEIIPQMPNTPVIFGALASDPSYSHDEIINYIKESGFSGINNFPTVALIDGQFREYLEENGMGYYTEVELMRKSVESGLFTVAFAFDEDQAVEMAKVGVDIICVNFGWTISSDSIINKSSLKKYINKSSKIFKAVNKINKDIIKVIYGGPVANPTQAEYFYDNSDTMGYIGGSSFEKIPDDVGIKATTSKFKNHFVLKNEREKARRKILELTNSLELIGESIAIKTLFDDLEKVINKNLNLVVKGENGVGKEAVAKYIIFSETKKLDYFRIDCLLTDEHEINNLSGGNVVILNPEALTLEKQRDLLKKITNLKSNCDKIRFISLTSKQLYNLVLNGEFLENLYYELSAVEINIPSINERREDIPSLVRAFLTAFEKELKLKKKLKITPEVLKRLIEFHYLGNIKELKHSLKSAAILAENNYIRIESLPDNIKIKNNNSAEKEKLYFDIEDEEIIDSSEKFLIKRILDKNNWNKTVSAKKLGFSRKTLYNKIKQYDIKP